VGGEEPGRPGLGVGVGAVRLIWSRPVHASPPWVATAGHEQSSPVCGQTALWVADSGDAHGNPVALRPHPTTLHPHLGTTLWMAVTGPVDGSCATRGQPVFNSGTGGRAGRPSTGPPIPPPPVPRLPPQPTRPTDQRRHAPSTLHTGPITAVGVLSIDFKEKRRGVDGSERGARIGCPLAGMTPGLGRLYGGAPRPGSSRRASTASGPAPSRTVRLRSRRHSRPHCQRERSPP
jgi:hypothetical protein